uniref:CSON008949 protein n=1 Tax=Culicoides sonorensis TaxID=179676 RepID=A0A336KDV3_CULSO
MEIKFKALIRNLLYKCKDEAVLSNERKTKLKLIDLGVLKLLGNCLTLNWDFMNRKDSMNMVSKKSSNDKHILKNIWDLFIFLFIRVILILYQIHFTQHYDDDES